MRADGDADCECSTGGLAVGEVRPSGNCACGAAAVGLRKSCGGLCGWSRRFAALWMRS